MTGVGTQFAGAAALFVGATVVAVIGSEYELDVLLLVGAMTTAIAGFLTTIEARYLVVAGVGSAAWFVAFQYGLQTVESSDPHSVGDHRPRPETHDFSAVGGMTELKRRLRERVLKPIERPERYERYGLGAANGILLYGPPGCGKTHIAEALAGESGFSLVAVTPTDITSKWVGEAADNVSELFETARAHQPCLVLLDELDAIAPNRSETGTSSQRQMTNQLLIELQNVEGTDVVVVGTTNRLDDIDPAIRRSGRFDDRIDVPPPDAAARRAILEGQLEDRPTTANLDLAPTVEATAGYASSDLKLVATLAARHAMVADREVDSDALAAAVDETSSSIGEWLPQYRSRLDATDSAVRVVQPPGVNLSAAELVDVDVERRFPDVPGRTAQKTTIDERILDPIRTVESHRPVGVSDVDGALLCGPPRNDADNLARAVAGELSIPLIPLTPQTIGGHPSASQTTVAEETIAIARANTPCVLFIENIDRLTPSGIGATQGASFTDLVAGLLTEAATSDAVVIATAETPSAVAEPVRNADCFDERIAIPLPGVSTRERLLRESIDDRLVPPEFDWERAAAVVEGLGTAAIRTVGEAAARMTQQNGERLTVDAVATAAEKHRDDAGGSPRYIE
jgi:transitional endoplasmic reticulum ATPase